jgi:hypothetical protein
MRRAMIKAVTTTAPSELSCSATSISSTPRPPSDSPRPNPIGDEGGGPLSFSPRSKLHHDGAIRSRLRQDPPLPPIAPSCHTGPLVRR